ncbi:hypothetical protein PQI23_06960 [Leucobacter sp. USCH14]|uniref:hypothetical protein n=1 Tax=Leucobacter sp. USCH14 TaxID=3024838 RepID=UPI00309ADBF3
MSIGKYVTNPGVIGSAFGAIGTARRTNSMHKDWRRYLIWAAWLAGLVLAIATVSMQEEDLEEQGKRGRRKR